MAELPDAYAYNRNSRSWPIVSAIKESYSKSMQALRQKLGRRPSPGTTSCSTRCFRALKHLQVLAVFSSGACVTMAAWSLASAEVVTMALLYYFLVPGARDAAHYTHMHYDVSTSLVDIVFFSCIRFLAVLPAYVLGSGRRMMRPYWYTAVAFAVASIPLLIVKAVLFLPRKAWLAPCALIVASVGFSLAHIGSATNVMLWARRRYLLGLSDYEKADPWEGLAEPDAQRQELLGSVVTPADLMDADSRFLQIGSLMVHYKLIIPEAQGSQPGTCVVLIHGFGGGVFIWRHVAALLAERCGCSVLCFDRPGFGLTSRPALTGQHEDSSPYTLESNADLAVQLCHTLQYSRVLLVGHADGAVAAVIAAAKLQAQRRDHRAVVVPSASLPVEEHHSRQQTLQDEHAEMLPNGHSQARPKDAWEPGEVSTSGPEDQGPQNWREVEVLGLVLLHPTAEDEGDVGPSFARLLGNSRLGRRMLVRMLRTEIGEVYNRAAWGDPALLTLDIRELYKEPLQIQGWDAAIIEVTRARKVGRKRLCEYFNMVQDLPALIVTGARDRVVPLRAAAAISSRLPASSCVMLPDVGHFSHEEAPLALATCLSSFYMEIMVQEPCRSC